MNKKISVVYVDDSAISLIAVEKILSTFIDATFNGGFSNADEALKFCAQRPPDIVFLDVEMPDKSGLWLASELQKIKIPFCFLTSHKKYAIAAFNLFALHYITKPASAISIREALYRVLAISNNNKPESVLISDDATKKSIAQHDRYPQRIFVNTQKQILILQLNEIVFIEAEGSYTKFNMADGTTLISAKNLKKYEVIVIKNPDFIKIHRSYIINQSNLVEINKKKTEMIFLFKNKMQIKVNDFRRDEWVNKFL